MGGIRLVEIRNTSKIIWVVEGSDGDRQQSKGSELAQCWESWKEVHVTQKVLEKTSCLDM